MTMIDEKLARLTAALLDKTQAEKVIWEPTASENVYLANFSKYAVSVRLVPYDETIPDYVLSLLNEDGVDIETKTARRKGEENYEELEQLFNLARRSAYNVEEGIDTILEALEEA